MRTACCWAAFAIPMQGRCRSPRSSAQSPAPAIRSHLDPMGCLAGIRRANSPYQDHNRWGPTMRIGFIGQGAMGSRMAARLLAAGHDLVVYDRLHEATRALEQRGATVAASAKQLAAGVDIV